MKCELCGVNEAVLYVQQMNKNEMKTFHLCINCLKERGISPFDTSHGVVSSLNNLISEITQLKSSVAQNSPVCPVCAENLYTIMHEKRCGCPECYTAFKTEITDLLQKEKITRNYTGLYKGDLPKKLPAFRSILTDRMTFHKKLEQAVANENYEQAAIYRDRLKALETQPLDGDFSVWNTSDD
ncbi:MAG: UvrB/UvrC motif-containing protein [Treponemataceae bacterium]